MRDIKIRVEKLKETINYHRYLYHVLIGRKFPTPLWILLSMNWRSWKTISPIRQSRFFPLKELATSLWTNSPKSSTKRGSGHSATLSLKKR